ncbi:MAG: protein kinase [Verrucomicrobiaceae bacterium]|nr:protein kinase [Verrucomicrobiaceae bacterium]
MNDTTQLLRDNARFVMSQLLDDRHIPEAEISGDMIGPYRLVSLLGAGGFGNVWKAEQIDPVRRDVALKLIKLGMDTVQVLGRFDLERQALATMEHPCIASLLDAGIGPGGRPFFVMELVNGEPVTKWCLTTSATLPEKLELFTQVCAAVEHAHQKGVVHRDLKPSNVLVATVDGQPTPKVIDFGIAKAIQSVGADGGTLLTQGDQVIGTPLYMAPEQLERNQAADTRTDVYALGVILYEMITETQPFSQITHGATDLGTMRRIITGTRPEKPSTAIKRLCRASQAHPRKPAAIPADLDWIMMRALEKSPERRYQGAAELAADLHRFLRGEAVEARPPSFGYLAGKWISRNKLAFLAACITLASLIGGAAMAVWQARRAADEAILARAAEKAALTSQQQAEAVAGYLSLLLDKTGEAVSKGRSPEALKDALTGTNHEILELNLDAPKRIELLQLVERVYSEIGEKKQSIQMGESILAELTKLHGPDADQVIATEIQLLYQIMGFGERQTVPARLLALRERVERTSGKGSARWMEIQRGLSRCYIKLEHMDSAIQAAQELIAAAQEARYSKSRLVLPQVMLATALNEANRADEALQTLMAALPQCRDVRHAEVLFEQLLRAYERQGNYQPAIQLLTNQLHPMQEHLGKDDPALQPLLLTLARLQSKNADHTQALAHATQAVDIARLHSQPQDLWLTLSTKVSYLASAKQLDEGIRVAKEALQLARKLDNPMLIVASHIDLAEVHLLAGRYDQTAQEYRSAFELGVSNNSNPRDAELVLIELASVQQKQGKPQAAIETTQELWTLLQARLHEEEALYLHWLVESLIHRVDDILKQHPALPPPPELATWRQQLSEQAQKLTQQQKQTAAPFGKVDRWRIPTTK